MDGTIEYFQKIFGCAGFRSYMRQSVYNLDMHAISIRSFLLPIIALERL